MKNMKRGFYQVTTYDGKISKYFKNYKSAMNYCVRLIAEERWCSLSVWNEDKLEFEEFYAC